MGDKILALGAGFLVTVLVARYLGPSQFGILSYVLSLVAIFSAAGHMGLAGLVVREVVKKPEERAELMGTALGLKFIGMLIGYLLLLIYAALYEGIESTEFLMIGIAGAALLLNPLNIIDFWFQAFVQARYTTIANLSGLAVSLAFKVALILLGAGVVYFSLAALIQVIVVAVVLLLLYKIKSEIYLSSWAFNWGKAKELLAQGWLIYLGAMFAIINIKVDQVMLRWLDDAESVGAYAVAAQLSETWYFVPTAIVASFFPKLIELRDRDEKQFYRRLQQLLDALCIMAVAVAILISLMGHWLIEVFFGASYSDSASILMIHIWGAVFIFMRAVFSRWILIEGLLVFSLITQGLGALVNVILNLYLIPRFGAEGAAYATLVSYAISSYLSLFIYGKTRGIFWLMTKSFFCPIRYFGYLLVKKNTL